MNIGFIGDFLYPLLVPENQNYRLISGSRVACNEFLNALIQYGTCSCSFFVFPQQENFIRSSVEQLRDTNPNFHRVTIYGISELKSQLENLSLIHDPMLHRAKALNNLRAIYGKKNIPLTIVNQALGHHLILNTCFSILTGAFLKEFDGIVCNSKHAEMVLRNLFSRAASQTNSAAIIPAKFSRIPWGVSETRFMPRNKADLRSQYNLPLDSKILLYAGRLSYYDKSDLLPLLFGYKNFLLRTAQSSPVILLFVGSDKGHVGYPPALRKYVNAMHLQDSVKIIENVPQDALPDYYSLSDIFISVSDTLTETFGITVLEAMATGLPVIISDWDGYKELVEDGKQGFKIHSVWGRMDSEFLSVISEIDDPLGQFYTGQSTAVNTEQLFACVESLLHNDQLRNSMSESAKQHVLRNYSWKQVIGQYEAMWSERIEKAKASKERPQPFLMMDFLKDFESYPTQIMSEDQKIVTAADGNLLAQKNYDLGYYPETKSLIRAEMAIAICRECVEPISMTDLRERLRGTDEQTLHHHIVWLLKYGFVKLRESTENR